MRVKVRTFREDDEEIWVQIVNKSIGCRRQPISTETIKKYKMDPYFDPNGVFFAYLDNEPVGMCYVKSGAFFEVKKGHFSAFHVLPQYRGTKVEEALYQEAIAYFKSKGLKEAEVMLLEDEQHLQNFFSSKGYQVHRIYLFLKRRLDKVPSSPSVKGLEVQSLRDGQLETFVNVANQAFSDAFAYYDFEPATVNEVKQQMQMYDVSCKDVKIAYLNDHPVGYVYMIKDSIAGIGVVKEHRKKGVGSALLIEGLRHLKSKGQKEVITAVNAENKPAVNFFRRHGFKEWKRNIFMKHRILRT
jgi:ribosomal protein S18 acetylase RimI-like enzyme